MSDDGSSDIDGGAAEESRRKEATRRRLAAKRVNEHVKLFASTINAIALATFGTAAILPAIGGAGSPNWAWIPVAILLHLTAQGAYRLLKSED
ncbi:MAG: hypothetical protein ACOYJQ_07070 [Pseudochelatococcus sp.]|jgi:hypothetical protein|uniref:hypothetical protein n=1 Tax=Pseudochelatococcus sp. TaxID=2020869 RepID=UPI003D8C4D39